MGRPLYFTPAIYLLLLGRIAVLRTYMWPIVTDRPAWSVGLSVGRSVTLMSPPKMAALIEMPFWVEDSGGPKEPCITWGSRSPMGMSNYFEGKRGVPL